MSQLLKKDIMYCAQDAVLACDGKCEKAWGINVRARVDLGSDPDDYYWPADSELGDAPADPGTYEGGHGKPDAEHKLESKWCARECERSGLYKPGEPVVLRDFSKRVYNIKSHEPKEDR